MRALSLRFLRLATLGFVALELGACDERVVDLGEPPDATGNEANAPACVCRVPCNTTTGTPCTNTVGTCGADGYCSGSVGTCTATTPQPCNAQFANSVCLMSTASSTVCSM